MAEPGRRGWESRSLWFWRSTLALAAYLWRASFAAAASTTRPARPSGAPGEEACAPTSTAAKKYELRCRRRAKDCDTFYQQSFLDSPTGYSRIEGDLDDIAKKSGVRISGYTFKQKVIKERGVTEIEITTNFDADYPAVIQFINGLERSKNFYLLDSLRLTSASTGGIRLDLDLHTYFRT